MSYILDALRRADAERERGAVPGLQSQQHTIVDDDDAATARPRSLVWAVVALAVAVLALLAWNFLGGGTAPVRAPVEGSITPAPAPLPTLPAAPAPATATLPAAPVAPVAPPHATTNAAAPQPATPAPVPAAATRQRAAPPVAAAPPSPVDVAAPPPTRSGTDARGATPPPASKRGAAPTAAPAAEPRVYAQSELPEDIRRDLPKVVIGGSSYSGDAASRMVMINGQVFHEGDRLAADLVLERIRLKSAVLSFKGWRYEVMF